MATANGMTKLSAGGGILARIGDVAVRSCYVNRVWSYSSMRRKAVKDDASGALSPAGWAEELDRGIEDVDQGRMTPVSDVISDLDATLAEMASEADNQVGHGNDIANRATTNRRNQS
jgi:hypothetical protein